MAAGVCRTVTAVRVDQPWRVAERLGNESHGRKLKARFVSEAGLASMRHRSHLSIVGTIAEIESAIERLPSPEVARLAAWLEEFLRRRRTVTDGGEHHDLDEFIGTWREDADFDAAQRAFAQVDEAMWK